MKRDLLIFQGAMILFVAAMLTLAGNYIYKKEMLRSRMGYITELQRQLAHSFEVKIQSVDDTLQILSETSEIKNCLYTKDKETKIYREQAVRDIFDSYEKIHGDYLNMILVYGDGEDYISNDMYRPVHESFYGEDWFLQAIQEGSAYRFDSGIRNLQSWKHYDSDSYISIARAVQEGDRTLGVLMVDVSVGEFKEAYQNLEADTENFFFLMDDGGEIILSPVNRIVYRVDPKWFRGDEGVVVSSIGDKNYKFVFNRFRDKKLLIVGAYDVEEESKIPLRMTRISIFMAGVCFVAAMIWSVCYLLEITKPLTELSDLMQSASEGNLDVRFTGESKEDIRILGEAFNKMVEKLKTLMEMMKLEQKQKREAELLVMQEQIKPHFLYNALDLIYVLCSMSRSEEAGGMTKALADFYRVALSGGKEIISLKEEMNGVRNYLMIQKNRYSDIFDFSIEKIEEELLETPIPKLSIEPLVENAIYHGIKPAKHFGHLRIYTDRVNEKVEIRVEDDGIGSGDRELSELIGESKNCGFGLRSVHERLKLYFGNDYGLKLNPVKTGFSISIFIPER